FRNGRAYRPPFFTDVVNCLKSWFRELPIGIYLLNGCYPIGVFLAKIFVFAHSLLTNPSPSAYILLLFFSKPLLPFLGRWLNRITLYVGYPQHYYLILPAKGLP